MTDSTDNAPERIWAYSHTGCEGIKGEWRPIDMSRMYGPMTEYLRADLAPDPLADARVQALEKALSVAMGYLTPMQPGDSRAVDDWFVACAAVQCNLDDSDGKINACLDEALAAFDKGGKDE